jgi:hypothetical protein
MNQWRYGICILCRGKGTIVGQTCPLCEGLCYWEYAADDNSAAVELLLHLGQSETNPAPDEVQDIFNRRLASIDPENLPSIFADLIGQNPPRSDEALQQAGAETWGWAWVHALRFAIELCKLLGVDYITHRQGVSLLAWKWLEDEKKLQKM